MKKEITDVQFRIFKGEVIAVFPYIIENDTTVLSYSHIGQHSACAWDINNFSKPAQEKDYLNLKNELTQLGYNLNVIKRRNQRKHLQAIKKDWL